MKPIYEFILWNTCKNHCAFCHQKANKAKYPGKFPTGMDKLKPVQLVREFIATQPIEDGSHILLMGGELFDSKLAPEVEAELLALASDINDGKYGYVYVNTNLIYTDTSLLFKFLDVFEPERLRFTTSFDFGYRFANDADRRTVLGNMVAVARRYPSMMRTANCILTSKAAEFFNSHNFYGWCTDFHDAYGFNIHLIPYIILHNEQALSRKDVLNFMLAAEKQHAGFLQEYALEGMCDQPRHIYEFDGTELKYASSGNSPCGHNENFKKVYKDSDACFVCDLAQLL